MVNMKYAIWTALAATIMCLSCYADSDAISKRMIAKAENILRGENIIPDREFVDSSGINKPTEQTWAFSIICKLAEKPTENFQRLAKSGSYYGMIGLRKYNPELFHEMINEFRGDPIVYLVSHDAFVMEEGSDFLSSLSRDEKAFTFERLIWNEIPDWTKTVRVRQPGKNP
jgi:hypothetical protein